MIWVFFVYNDVGQLEIIEELMIIAKYIQILLDCLQTSVEKLEQGSEWLFQQDNDVNYMGKKSPCMLSRQQKSTL